MLVNNMKADGSLDWGMLARGAGAGFHHPAPQKAQYQHPNRDFYNPSPISEQEQPYYDDYQQPRPQSYAYEPSEARGDDVFQPLAQQKYVDMNVSSSSLNDGYPPPLDVAALKDEISMRPRSRENINALYSSNKSLDQVIEATTDVPSYPVVKLRTRKARDKGIPIERPRSWHASKHPDLETGYLAEEGSMRSPGYPGSPASQKRYYQQQPLSQPRRKSKGWFESGDLKSVYKGEVNGSKDSLISGGSHQSYRSGRLSVSSSRSSGTMSSSRGSLENLLDNPYSTKGGVDLNGYPQVIIGNGNRLKTNFPSKPHVGIVSQQKNMFEKLSQDSYAGVDVHQYSRGSREDLEKISRVRRTPSEDADRDQQYKRSSTRESSKSPSSYQSGSNSRRSSFSPPPVNAGSVRLRNRSHDRDTWQSNNSSNQNNGNQRSDVSKRASAELKYSDAKIVKTNFDSNRNLTSESNQPVPAPPTRDSSSAQAVKNYHSHSQSGISQDDYQYSSSPSERSSVQSSSPLRKSPSRVQSPQNAFPMQNSSTSQAEPTHRITVTRPIEKSIEPSKGSGRHERMFGVMSVGNSRNIVATSLTVSPKAKDVKQDKADDKNANLRKSSDSENRSSISAPRYEHLKDTHTVQESNKAAGTDYVSRKTSRVSKHDDDQSSRPVAEHSKSGSSESNDSDSSKGKGKYGSVWKAPQPTHRRARSTDFSTFFQDTGNNEQPKLSVFKPKDPDVANNNERNTEDVNGNLPKTRSTGNLLAAGNDENKNPDIQIDNLPSILRSLQNTQHGDRRYKNFEPKNANDNYEKIWFSESRTSTGEDSTKVTENKTSSDSDYSNIEKQPKKNWKSEFKEVDLDEAHDDAFGPQDRYCNDIKDMSRKVLRVTSFTRKDLDVSPSTRTFEQKKRQFQFPSKPYQKQAHLAVIHSRSRSHGHEIDEDSEPILTQSKKDSSGVRPRPKSAGVTRPLSDSYRSDDSMSPISKSPNKIVSPSIVVSSANRRVSIDVRPDLNTSDVQKPQVKSKQETRKAVFNFISMKAGRSFDGSSLGHAYTSSSSIHTSHSDETDKRRSKENGSGDDSRISKLGSSGDIPSEARMQEPSRETTSTPTSYKPENVASVRKLKNFKETRDKFMHGFNRLTSRTKSTSSLLEEESVDDSSQGRPSPMMSGDKSASVENLTDSGLDISRSSPTENIERTKKTSPPTRRDRSKSTPNIDPISPPHNSPLNELVQAPRRKHPKHHRQRYSNSSSASSATTISTLSSFSSSSSASIGRFPALGEESEQSPVISRLSPPPPSTVQSQAPSSVQSIDVVSKQSESSISRIPIDTGTYRVAKRKSIGKSPPTRRSQNQEMSYKSSTVVKLKSTKEIMVNSNEATPQRNRSSSGESDEKPDVSKPREEKQKSPKILQKSKSNAALLENQEKVNSIIEKVKRSASFREGKPVLTLAKSLPLPPTPPPLDDATEMLLQAMVVQRESQDLPPPPNIPAKSGTSNSLVSSESTKDKSPTQSMTSMTSQMPVHHHNGSLSGSDPPTVVKSESGPSTPPTSDTYREVTYLLDTDSDSEQRRSQTTSNRGSTGPTYENVHINGANHPYENVFKPIQGPPSIVTPPTRADQHSPTPAGQGKANMGNSKSKSDSEVSDGKDSIFEQKAEDEIEGTKPNQKPVTSPPPEISAEPLVPDVSLLPDSSASLQQEHPDLTLDIIKGDRALAQVLTSSNKKTLDYMAGVLSQPSHDIVEEGMRYRRRKPTAPIAAEAIKAEQIQNGKNIRPVPSEDLLKITVHPHIYLQRFRNDISSRDNLPASSTYYKTSASKAKILSLVKEKIAGGEIAIEDQESFEDINRKKMELVLSIKGKLNDLQSMKGLLDVEMRENECLGKQVYDLTKTYCTPREQEKYNIFVQEVDKIINLLLSLSGRLARVENAIQMLRPDADKQEMDLLCEKRKRLTEQLNEAKSLKENIDRRQKAVSECLAGYFDQEQFADYEHYIKMKSALIMEQRELDDKAKLGEEQMQCLRDSLPEEWQIDLDRMTEE